MEERFLAQLEKTPSCWIWRGTRIPKGYGMVNYYGKDMRAHRVAYLLFVGPIPTGLWVLHECDNPPCVNPAHLFLGTATDNVRDMERKARAKHPAGADNGLAKLSDSLVLEMRRMYATGAWSFRRLAARFGVSAPSATAAVRGETWKHLSA